MVCTFAGILVQRHKLVSVSGSGWNGCSIIFPICQRAFKKCLCSVSLARERITGLALPGNPEPKLLWQARSKCNIQPGPPSRKCDGVLQNLGRASPKPGTNVNFASKKSQWSLFGASKKPRWSLCFSRDSRLNRGSIEGASRLQRGKMGSTPAIISDASAP